MLVPILELDDNINRKEMFIKKEQEVLNQLSTIKNEISNYQE